MKKRMIIGLLLGLAITGAQQAQVTANVSDFEKAVVSYVGNALVYVISSVAGTSRNFSNSLLLTGAILPLPRVGNHLGVDEKIVESSKFLHSFPFFIGVLDDIKGIVESAFEKTDINTIKASMKKKIL